MNGKLSIRELALPMSLVMICVVFSTLSPHFLTARNLTMLMIEFSITAVLAIGMLMVILTGQIDLSVGSGVGLIGGIASVLVFRHHFSAPVAMTVGICVALALWTTMGSLIVLQKMPSFIITLGGLLVFKGLFWLVISSSTIPVVAGGQSNLYSILATYYISPFMGWVIAAIGIAVAGVAKYRARQQRRLVGLSLVPWGETFISWLVLAQAVILAVIVCNQYRGIPLSLMILVVFGIVIDFICRHTTFGRYLYAIGGNEEAAFLSGIPVARIVIGAYAILGFIVGMTGFLQTSYSGASTSTVGDLMELDAIAACVMGGASLKGGKGTVAGVLLGALIMACLLNGMTLLAVSPEKKFIARGLVLALAVWVDIRLGKGK
jgi:D-xylose transport system permease protein